MFKLKPIEKDAIPRALSKAERYRLLNEPREAESICRDILAIDPSNNDATVCLVLALTDLFEGEHVAASEVRPLVATLKSDYERAYYAGMVEERWSKAMIKAGHQPSRVDEFIRAAMDHFAAAESLAPASNDDAVLRWNACVRFIQHHHITPPAESDEPADVYGDDVPVR